MIKIRLKLNDNRMTMKDHKYLYSILKFNYRKLKDKAVKNIQIMVNSNIKGNIVS
jgi:hypothetical protein